MAWLQRNWTGCCSHPHPILFHPLFVFLPPPGLLGGFPLSAGPVHLLPGFLHGWLVRSTPDPPVHRSGEGHPRSGLPGKRGGCLTERMCWWMGGTVWEGLDCHWQQAEKILASHHDLNADLVECVCLGNNEFMHSHCWFLTLRIMASSTSSSFWTIICCSSSQVTPSVNWTFSIHTVWAPAVWTCLHSSVIQSNKNNSKD